MSSNNSSNPIENLINSPFDINESSLQDNNVTNEIKKRDVPKIENDNVLYKLREKRIQQLKKKKETLLKHKSKYEPFTEITEEELMKLIVQPISIVCHVFSLDFSRCSILDTHLIKIAPEYRDTIFVKVSANKAPFLSFKLKIRILPTLLYFKDGFLIHSSVGFSDFGGSDNFSTLQLLKVLYKFKLIKKIDLNNVYDEDNSSCSDSEDL